MESPEVHQPHAHPAGHGGAHGGGLPRWLELTLAISALVTSVSSIAIALHHGQTMEKLVEANSIPYLTGGISDETLDGADVLSLDFVNRGVGPAHEKSLRLKVGDRYVRNMREFLGASLGPQYADEKTVKLLHIAWNRVPTRFVPGGQSQFVFKSPKTAENAVLWERLIAAEPTWRIEFCYCSVFEDCWQVQGEWKEPAKVKQCVRDEGREFMP